MLRTQKALHNSLTVCFLSAVSGDSVKKRLMASLVYKNFKHLLNDNTAIDI